MICSESANVLPATIDDDIITKIHVCDNTDEIVKKHTGIFINAIREKMPEYNLKVGINGLDDVKEGDLCNIYCAQSSCSDAIEYMNDNKDDLMKCDKIYYLHQGAIKMEKNH